MTRDERIHSLIKDNAVTDIIKNFFDDNFSEIMPDFLTETYLWDYKQNALTANSSALEWAECAKDVLSFYNAKKGGLIFWGIKNTYDICGINKDLPIDSKILNDKLRTYIGDKIWVEYYNIANKKKNVYLGLIIIPVANTSGIVKFSKNGPEKHHRPLFYEGGSAIRKHDSSCIISPLDARKFYTDDEAPTFSQYEIDEPGFRLLAHDYHEFLIRREYCENIIKGLSYSRAAVVSLTGIGGVGKTALACWAVLNAYKNNQYSYIVSITAKDRELTSQGIQSINQNLTTLDDLLNSILEVVGFNEYIDYKVKEKEKVVRQLIENENVLLFVDNLETTSDPSIIDFLNDLPNGVKAIVTSRRTAIRVSSYPIEIGPLSNQEAIRFIKSISTNNQNSYVFSLTDTEMEQIGNACNKLPLAMKWIISRCRTVPELLSYCEGMMAFSNNSNQLLEFSFRRIFDNMSKTEKNIMQILALINDPPIEAILHGLNAKGDTGAILDSIEILTQDTIIYKRFDAELRGYRYSLLPLTKQYILTYCIDIVEERTMKKRLKDWYEANDITDPEERTIMREMRQGNKNIGDTLIDFAKNALNRGDFSTSKRIFESALMRDPKNWRVYREYAEYYRHSDEKSDRKAVDFYKRALTLVNGEKMSQQIALLHREFAILYTNCGEADSVQKAIEHFEIALNELPHDGICAKKLSELYLNRGYTDKVVQILSKFKDSKDVKTKENLLPILYRAYKQAPQKYLLEISELKLQMAKDKIPFSE